MSEMTNKHCNTCQMRCMHQRESFDGGIHLIVIVITCGLWLPFAVLFGLLQKLHPFKCSQCGSG